MLNAIADHLGTVNAKIATAAKAAGRASSDVRLIAVSKTQPIEAIREALAAGQKSFGENYVQEALVKIQTLEMWGSKPMSKTSSESKPESKPEWHLIGSIQTGKVKQIVGHFQLIHSVDRLKLATEISKGAGKQGLRQDILLQVHIGDEATKHGASFDEVPEVLEKISVLPNLRLCGLMALPPLTDDEKIGRGYFASLRNAMEVWRKQCLSGQAATDFKELSIGTSSDFEWAVLEGATLVRVGTSIFGTRPTS
jgi:pyridoxal phosphate enzyme (YggS family)